MIEDIPDNYPVERIGKQENHSETEDRGEKATDYEVE